MKDRIAIVVNTLSSGGAEKTASNLSRQLSRKYEVDIIVNDEEHLNYPYVGQVISLHMPPEKERMGAVYQTRALIRRVRLLGKLKKSRGYKATLSFSEMTNLANVLSGGKTIISVHNSVNNSRTKDWKHRTATAFILPLCFRRADKTVSCSKEIADVLINEYGLPKEKSFVIYNGIDIDAIRKKAAEPLTELPFHDTDKLIVTAGRLVWEKGHWHLIKAVKRLLDDNIPAKLVILGDGGLRAALEELVEEANLGNAVFLPGFVQNPYQYMALSDVVVFPSMTEGFSNAIVEALACGAAVVSTDHETGAREILAPDTDYRAKVKDGIENVQYGILVPVCDGMLRHMSEPLTEKEELLSEAIRTVLFDPALKKHYREVSVNRVEPLELEKIAEEWSKLIEN